jgi:hypothetical protein
MVIDRTGALAGVTGIDEMIARSARALPQHDFSLVRSGAVGAATQAAVRREVEGRWLDWVGLWMRYDPSRGVTQEVTIDGAGGSFSTIVESKGSAEGHVKLRAHRQISAADLGPVARSINPLLGDAGIDMSQALQGGDSVMDVDTEWPELRPRHAHMRSTVRFSWEGREHGGRPRVSLRLEERDESIRPVHDLLPTSWGRPRQSTPVMDRV